MFNSLNKKQILTLERVCNPKLSPFDLAVWRSRCLGLSERYLNYVRKITSSPESGEHDIKFLGSIRSLVLDLYFTVACIDVYFPHAVAIESAKKKISQAQEKLFSRIKSSVSSSSDSEKFCCKIAAGSYAVDVINDSLETYAMASRCAAVPPNKRLVYAFAVLDGKISFEALKKESPFITMLYEEKRAEFNRNFAKNITFPKGCKF